MSLYSEYIKERTNKIVYENDDCFAVVSFTNDCVYIEDIFVVKEKRHLGLAKKLADLICFEAKSKGYKILLGSVCPYAEGSTESLKILLAYGMKLVSSDKDLIFFKKELI
jgi:hypothetical protein